MASLKLICPTCLIQREGMAHQSDDSLCGDCGSEGIDSSMVPINSFLETSSLAGLNLQLQEWTEAVDRFKPFYHRLVMKRLRRFIVKKRVLSGLPPFEPSTVPKRKNPLLQLLYHLTRKNAEISRRALSEFFKLSPDDQRCLFEWALRPPDHLSVQGETILSAFNRRPAESMKALLRCRIDLGNYAVATQIEKWGKSASTVLLKELYASDEAIRRRALYYVRFVKNPTAELGEALEALLKTHSEPADRALAAEALGRIAQKQSRFSLSLVESLRDSDADVREKARNVLADIRPIQAPVLNRLLKELEETTSEKHLTLLFLLLGQVGPSAAKALPLIQNVLKRPLEKDTIMSAIFLLDQWQRQKVSGAKKLLSLYQKKCDSLN